MLCFGNRQRPPHEAVKFIPRADDRGQRTEHDDGGNGALLFSFWCALAPLEGYTETAGEPSSGRTLLSASVTRRETVCAESLLRAARASSSSDWWCEARTA